MKRIFLILFCSCWASVALADKTPNPPPEQKGGCSTSPAAPESASLLALLGLALVARASRRSTGSRS
jgi:MYXO-CTERM domain-containing protein